MNRLLLAAAVLAASSALSSCGRNGAAQTPGSTDPSRVNVVEVPDTNIVQIPDSSRFPLATAVSRPFADQLHVNGSVAPDVALSVPVLSLAAGRAVQLLARLGDHVEKGQVLVRIDSPDVSNAISTFQQAAADELLARKQLDRTQLLLDKGAYAVKDVEIAQDAHAKAAVALHTAEKQLLLYGADPGNPSPVIDIKAPVSGYIVEQNVTAGTAVKSTDNSPNLFTIADLSRVWVVCDVFENNLSQVHSGEPASIRLNAYPDRELRGRISNIATLLDPATRSAKVRIELANPAGLMRVGMFAVATFTAPSAAPRLFIASTAVMRLHDRDWVFRPIGNSRFRRTEILAGAATPDGAREVVSGLAPGDTVVANALQMESAATNQ